MQEQNYANHKRYVPGFHFISFGVIILLFIGSVISLVKSFMYPMGHLIPTLLVMTSGVLGAYFYYMRAFPIRAQDRAIRAEENLRHFALTGKLFDPQLTMSQIIALRFAPDDEFVKLAVRAVAEKLSGTDIKKSIKNWRADNHRA